MAKVAATRHNFQFQIQVDGLNAAECQKFTLSEINVESVPHGDTNGEVNTAGRVTYTEAVFEKIRPVPGSDTWAWDWINAAQNRITGGAGLPQNVKRMVIVREMDNSGVVVLNSWFLHDCLPVKLSQEAYDRMSSDNQKETLAVKPDAIERK